MPSARRWVCPPLRCSFHITEAAHPGVNVKALSARVGHASVAFTLDRYVHAIEAGNRDVADAVSRRLGTSQDGDGQADRTGTDSE